MQDSQRMDGRARRRLEAMRRVQEVALGLFEARGYEAVTVEEVAAAADVGAATVYRHFGTKERVVLWDEYDPMLFEAITARLTDLAPVPATLEALVSALDRIYAQDAGRILRRSRLVLAHPALRAASAAERAAMQAGLAQLFLDARAVRDVLEAAVVAGAIVATLEAALGHWVREEGRTPLRQVLRRAFRHLGRLSPADGPR